MPLSPIQALQMLQQDPTGALPTDPRTQAMLQGRMAQDSQLDEMKRNLDLQASAPNIAPSGPYQTTGRSASVGGPGMPSYESGATPADVGALQRSMGESPNFGDQAQAQTNAVDVSNLKGMLEGYKGGSVQQDPRQAPAGISNETPSYTSKPVPQPGQQAAIGARQMESEKIQAPINQEMVRAAGTVAGADIKGEQALALAKERQTAQTEMMNTIFAQHPELIGKLNIPGMMGVSQVPAPLTGGAQKDTMAQLQHDRTARQDLESSPFAAFGQSIRGNIGGDSLETAKANLDAKILAAERELRVPHQAVVPKGGTAPAAQSATPAPGAGRQVVGSGPFSVVHPNGKEYRFNTQAAYDKFKQQFQIK